MTKSISSCAGYLSRFYLKLVHSFLVYHSIIHVLARQPTKDSIACTSYPNQTCPL